MIVEVNRILSLHFRRAKRNPFRLVGKRGKAVKWVSSDRVWLKVGESEKATSW